MVARWWWLCTVMVVVVVVAVVVVMVLIVVGEIRWLGIWVHHFVSVFVCFCFFIVRSEHIRMCEGDQTVVFKP